MFLGKHTSILQINKRILIPSSFRKEVSDGFYLTQGFERNLLGHTTASFENICQRIKSLNIADPLARSFIRMFLSTAEQSKAEDDGSMVIPAELADFANLGRDVLFIGQGDYFEIWSAEIWNQQESQLKDAEANATRFATLTIATR